VNAGEVVTLLGRNGAGKTTTMRAIMGMLATARAPSPRGWEPIHLRSNRIARKA
jgi:branched-chain amino acid transport system ATP-binding protein